MGALLKILTGYDYYVQYGELIELHVLEDGSVCLDYMGDPMVLK